MFLYKKIYEILMLGKVFQISIRTVGIKRRGKTFILNFFIWAIFSLVASFYLLKSVR